MLGLFRAEVIDTGAGIAKDDQRRVFNEFAQFNRNELQGGGSFLPGILMPLNNSHLVDRTGGSGLGLWISRKIVTMHEV